MPATKQKRRLGKLFVGYVIFLSMSCTKIRITTPQRTESDFALTAVREGKNTLEPTRHQHALYTLCNPGTLRFILIFLLLFINTVKEVLSLSYLILFAFIAFPLSQDLDELIEISHRISVIFNGNLSKSVDTAKISIAEIGLLMGGKGFV